MSGTKKTISQLPVAPTVSGTDLLAVTQGSVTPGTGTSRRATVAQILQLLEAADVSVAVVYSGKPAASARTAIPINQEFTLPAGLVGTVSDWVTNPTSNANFLVSTWLGGTLTAQGTITIASTGSVTITNGPTGDVALGANSMIVLDAPSVQDATLANGGVTFLLRRANPHSPG